MNGKTVLHKQNHRQNSYGGLNYGTLCGLKRNDGEDINCTGADAEVTCKRCLNMLAAKVETLKAQALENKRIIDFANRL